MDIGSRLKELRILKGLTQEELADRAELSKGFISQVERNLTSPSIATLMDILQCLLQRNAGGTDHIRPAGLFRQIRRRIEK